MNRSALTASLLILSFIGLADAWYLTDTAFTGASLSCSITGLDGCNIVAQSPYSHLFGLPLALYGVIFYGVLFALAALISVWPLRPGYRALRILGILGILASILFLLIQFVFIKALCVYCLLSGIVSLFAWLVTAQLWKYHLPPKLVSLPPHS